MCTIMSIAKSRISEMTNMKILKPYWKKCIKCQCKWIWNIIDLYTQISKRLISRPFALVAAGTIAIAPTLVLITINNNGGTKNKRHENEGTRLFALVAVGTDAFFYLGCENHNMRSRIYMRGQNKSNLHFVESLVETKRRILYKLDRGPLLNETW